MTKKSILVLMVLLSCMLIVCGSVSADDLVLDKEVKAVEFDTGGTNIEPESIYQERQAYDAAYTGSGYGTQVDSYIIETAVDGIDPHTPIESHPLNLTLSEIRETIADICSDTSLNPDEKLQAQTEVLGMDARLQAWLEAERDEETGEPIYPENIPVITPILSFFGLAKETPAEPYTQAEGEAAYAAYLDLHYALYKPTGEFGGPIE